MVFQINIQLLYIFVANLAKSKRSVQKNSGHLGTVMFKLWSEETMVYGLFKLWSDLKNLFWGICELITAVSAYADKLRQILKKKAKYMIFRVY